MKNCKFRRKHCKFRRLLAQVLFLWYNNNAEKIICEGRSFLCGNSFQNTVAYSHLLHLLLQLLQQISTYVIGIDFHRPILLY